MSGSLDVVIADIPKGRNIVRVAIRELEGAPHLSLWTFFQPTGGGEPRPGLRGGLTIPAEQLPAVADAINAALKVARTKGYSK